MQAAHWYLVTGHTLPAAPLHLPVFYRRLFPLPGRQSAQQGGAQEAVLDDPAHGRGLLGFGHRFAMIEMQEQRARPSVMTGIRDADVENRLGLVRADEVVVPLED